MAAAPVPRSYHSWSAPTSVNGSPDASPTRIKTSSLQTQIEFYFSPQNLTSDAYLRSQMDEERFVPIAVIAEFKLVKKITTDIDLIVDVIRRSKLLELDEATTKVRASLKATERQTIILRDISADTPVEQIRAIFNNEECGEVVNIRADIGDTWFVSFRDEDSCMKTAEYLSDVTFNDCPIRFRVKSENQTRAFHQEKILPPPFIPMVMYPGSGRASSWNIRKAPLFPGDSTGVFVPSMMMNRRSAATLTPEDRRRPVARKPRDGNVQPGSSTPNAPSRQIRKQRQIRSVPFSMRRDEGCVDGVPLSSQPQPDLGLEHFPALPSSSRTPVPSCPPSPSKDKSYAETAIEDPLSFLYLIDSPPAGGQAAPASTSPSSAIDEYRNETDVIDKTVSYASIARRAAENKHLSD